MRFTYITTEEEIENIKHYEFKSIDDGLSYNYIFSPLCERTQKILPPWLAPNLITLAGLFVNIIIHVLVCWYTGLSGESPTPSWVCFTMAFLYNFYIFLDCLDGKQARATKSSSPMGLLLDHGVDACTTWIFLSSYGSIFRLTTLNGYAMMWLLASIPFFLSTWEEYYTNCLYLPIFNGVCDGGVLAAIVLCFTGFVGSDFWINRATFFGTEFKYGELAAIFFFTVSLNYGIQSIWKVFREKREFLLEASENLVVFILLVASLISVANFSDSKLAVKYPKLVIYLYGFAFCKLVAHLQLAHLCNSRFYQFRKTIFLSSVVLLLLSFIKLETFHIDYFIIMFLMMQFIAWAHMVYFLSEEICNILKIRRFTICSKLT